MLAKPVIVTGLSSDIDSLTVSFHCTDYISFKSLQVEAYEHLVAGNYKECIAICKRCNTKVAAALGENSPELIYTNLVLCEVYTKLTKYSEALEAIQQAGLLLDCSPGLTDSHMFRVFYHRDLAILHRIQLRFNDAQVNFQKVVDIRRKYQGERHPDTAFALMDLALVHKVCIPYIFRCLIMVL